MHLNPSLLTESVKPQNLSMLLHSLQGIAKKTAIDNIDRSQPISSSDCHRQNYQGNRQDTETESAVAQDLQSC